MRYLKTNTAVIVTVGPFFDKTDGVTIETALTITNERITLVADTDAGSAPTLILDNITGATSGTSNDLNYIASNDAGLMQLELAAADVNRLGRLFLTITDAANHVPVFHEFTILPAVIYDSLILGTDLLQTDLTQILGDAQSATDLKDFADAGYDPSTNKVQGVVLTDTVTTYTGNTPQTGDSFARLGAPAGASVSADIAAIEAQTDDIGVAGAGLTNIPAGATNPDVLITTTITGLANQTLWSLTAGSGDDNAYNGCRFVITDASTAVQKCVGVVNIYSGATKTMSPLNDPGIFTIANGDAISIMADRAVHPDIDNTVLDIDPSTGNVGIDWGNVANKTTSNVLSGTTVGVATLVNGLAAGVITAAAIATDAIDADAIADSALDAGAFTAGAANKLADHVLRRKQANVEASANGDSVTDAGSVYGFVQQARQSNTVDNAGFLTVYETDGSTELEQLPLDTDAAADPVVGVG